MDTDQYGHRLGSVEFFAGHLAEEKWRLEDVTYEEFMQRMRRVGVSPHSKITGIVDYQNGPSPTPLIFINPDIVPEATKALTQAISAIPDMIRALENIAALADHLDLPNDKQSIDYEDPQEVSTYVLDLVMPALEKAVGR